MPDSVTDPGVLLRLALAGAAAPEVPPDCVLTHSRAVLRAAREALPHETVDIGLGRPLPLHLARPPSTPAFGLVGMAPGAPVAAAVLEELIALGFTRFWCVGTAGHPTRELPGTLAVGDLVLVDRALVREGTSGHYAPGVAEALPDRGLRDRLAAALEARSLRYAAGVVATTDALYRETPAFLHEVLDQGAIALDMELSAVFSVARFRGVRAAALLVVSDVVPARGAWVPGFADPALREAEGALLPVLRACLEAG